MGEDVKSKLYAIDKKTGEEFGIGGIMGTDIIPDDEEYHEKIALLGENEFSVEVTIPIFNQTISKKRFIKLLMGNGYQKRDAISLHDTYMNLYKSRHKFQSLMFIKTYGAEKEGKIEKIGVRICDKYGN